MDQGQSSSWIKEDKADIYFLIHLRAFKAFTRIDFPTLTFISRPRVLVIIYTRLNAYKKAPWGSFINHLSYESIALPRMVRPTSVDIVGL
jgi:hypothetical protein